MRVTTSLWVGALLRRSSGAGLFGAVRRHGADEAGAVFIVVNRLDGTADLYAPAPQTAFIDNRPTERLFQRVADRAAEADISSRIASEVRFDTDLWVVEIESRSGETHFDTVE